MTDLLAFTPLIIFGGVGVLTFLPAISNKNPGLVAIGIMAIVVGLCLSPIPLPMAPGPAANATPTPVPTPPIHGWNCTYLNQSDTSAGFVCLPKNAQGIGS